MKIGFLLPSVFASTTLFPDRIFAPGQLARDSINGLVHQGHEVYVFSTPDFVTNGQLIPGDVKPFEKKLVYDKLKRADSFEAKIRNDEVWKRTFEISVTTQAYKFTREHHLDIVHAYHDFLFTPHYLEEVTQIPTVYTLHDPLPPEESFEYHELGKFKDHSYVSISNSQRKSSLSLNFVDTVYHGIDLTAFPFQKQSADYALFMGRLVPEKGLHNAIAAACKINVRLEIGTQLPDILHESEYFKKQIKPFLSNPLIGEPGILTGENKITLYKDALALLFPIEWEEPFGIVMIEAMSTGTPVIAYNRGSVSEIVKDGVTGFIIDPDNQNRPNKGSWIIKEQGVEGLVVAMNRLNEINRVACREHVTNHFSVSQMVAGYEKVYQKIIQEYQKKTKDIVYEGSSRRV